MTSEEIRKSESGESKLGNEIAYWLREIAAQLAEFKERRLFEEVMNGALIDSVNQLSEHHNEHHKDCDSEQ